jgi:hypothetical protein
MPKVINHFYCLQEKKTYTVGSDYTGTRKDLKIYLDDTYKPKKENKNGSKVKLEKK